MLLKYFAAKSAPKNQKWIGFFDRFSKPISIFFGFGSKFNPFISKMKKPGLIFYVVQCNIDLNLDPGFLSCTLCWLCTFKHFSTSSWGVKRLKTLSKSFLSCSLSLWMFTVVRFFFCDCFKNLYNFALVFLKNYPFHVMRLFWTSLHWAKQTIWSLEVFYRVLVWTYLRVSPHRFPQQTDKHGTAIRFHLLGLFVARLQRYGLLLAVLGYCL